MKRDPNLEQIATETFLVPTDWVGYDNFPEKVPNFRLWEICFSCLINGSLFQEIFPGKVHLSPHSQLQKLFNCSILNDLIILKFCNFDRFAKKTQNQVKKLPFYDVIMTSKSFCETCFNLIKYILLYLFTLNCQILCN